MNNDGWGNMGAGQDDLRLQGSDMQHYANKGSGRPIREMLDEEQERHDGSKKLRLEHLKRSEG